MTASATLDQIQEEIEAGITEAEQTIDEQQQKLEALGDQIAELMALINQDPDGATEEQKAQLATLQEQYAVGSSAVEAAKGELEVEKQEAQARLAEIEKKRAELSDGQKALELEEADLQEKEAYFAESIAPVKEKLEKQKHQWEAGVQELEAGKEALAKAKEETEAQFASGEQQIAATQSKLRSSEAELSTAASQIASGKSQIQSAKNTIAQKERELTEAETELADGRKELDKGRKEYESQKADAESRLADAQSQINDARSDVEKLDEQTWYVNDRDILAEYTSYGENADRMRAIGEVFPELFFLVAALISLTTMTRMVEEERTQIGTMKALGYGKGAIAGKYLMYAFLATMGGSVFGVLIGEKVFPYIIIYSYQIMYTHLPHIVVPYQWNYAAMATAAALACTLLATLYACYKELAAQPAELMRPPSPKEGKRILLERVSILWRHLSFTWKSSVRNLFRYKKRFFMTIAGIGGCMALMVVGFGLRDSIMCIGTIQYQIGTMKALGYGKGAIAGKYLMYAFLATMGGSVFGVLIGEKVFPYIIIYSYQIMYTHLPHIVVPYQWNYAAMATAAALACTLLATLYACYKELAAQPAELMRPPSPKEGKRILLERVSILWRHLSFTWKSSVRNLFRYKKRFFMTIAGIGGCMALMVVGFGLRDSIMCIGTIQYQELQVYDGMVYLSNSVTDEEIRTIMNTMDEMGKMDRYMEMEMMKEPIAASADGKTEDVYLCVPEDKDMVDEFMTFRDRTSGEIYHLTDDGVILTEKMAKTLDVSRGDPIYIGVDGEEKEVTVTDICENYMEHYVYMTAELYEELYGEEPGYNSILFDLKNASDKEISDAGETLLKYDGVMNVTYTNNIEDQLNTMLESLNLVIVVLIISAGLLAFVVLYNLNNINITERRRELATLKVLGFYDAEVSSYVYRENIMLTLFSIVIGIGLGAVLHRFVITTVEVDAVMFGRVVNWRSYLYSALFTVGFSLFVNWVMYYKLKKIDMVESLKSVE